MSTSRPQTSQWHRRRRAFYRSDAFMAWIIELASQVIIAEIKGATR